MAKIRYTYTVSREETVTKAMLKEYGELMEDEPMTLEKYIKYQKSFCLDDGAECLEDADPTTFKVSIKKI